MQLIQIRIQLFPKHQVHYVPGLMLLFHLSFYLNNVRIPTYINEEFRFYMVLVKWIIDLLMFGNNNRIVNSQVPHSLLEDETQTALPSFPDINTSITKVKKQQESITKKFSNAFIKTNKNNL